MKKGKKRGNERVKERQRENERRKEGRKEESVKAARLVSGSSSAPAPDVETQLTGMCETSSAALVVVIFFFDSIKKVQPPHIM